MSNELLAMPEARGCPWIGCSTQNDSPYAFAAGARGAGAGFRDDVTGEYTPACPNVGSTHMESDKFVAVCLCSYDGGATTSYLYQFGGVGTWNGGGDMSSGCSFPSCAISTACSNDGSYGVVACAADNLELAAPPPTPPPPATPPFPPDAAPLPLPPSPPPAICHANCPQNITMVTPLSESSRLLSNTTNSSLNDCNLPGGWYHFPGTRMAIRDIDGEPPQGRCGAGDGMMSMVYGSEVPQRGANKSALTLCAPLPVPPAEPGEKADPGSLLVAQA